MVSSHRIYIGPYVYCASRVGEFDAFQTGCPNGCADGRHGVVGQFCRTCGAKLASLPVKVSRKIVDADQVESEFQGTLRVFGRYTNDFKDCDVFVPNMSWPGQPSRDIDEHFSGEVQIKDSDLPTERVRFELAFQRQLAHLRFSYGANNVEVRWGVLGEWA